MGKQKFHDILPNFNTSSIVETQFEERILLNMKTEHKIGSYN
jgi:hypothetical protein